jgi:hypothetical protein
MTSHRHIRLGHRCLISVTGEDRRTFLQGLLSVDVAKAASRCCALYGAFLTPQGKFLHEFFLAEQGDELVLETEEERHADFVKRLNVYRLRSKVAIRRGPAFDVYALIGDDAAEAVGLPKDAGAARRFADGLVFVDPRLPAAGLRCWLPAGAEAALREAGFAPAETAIWDLNRIRLGLPDGSRDMVPEKAMLLENGFDELHGVDWQKGCFLGQELTARTRYRGLIRKRLMPVEIDGRPPEPGTPIRLGDSEAGEMRSHAGSLGLALIRLDALAQLAEHGGTLSAGRAALSPIKPEWAQF